MLLLALACSPASAPATAPARAPGPEPQGVVSPTATGPAAFDCPAWGLKNHLQVDFCSESPHLPGLYLLQSKNGGDTRYVAVRDGKPLKGGGAAVAAFLRSSAAWERPLTAEDVAGVLLAFGSYPPGFSSASPATFDAPLTYRIASPLSDWQGHGGPNAVAGAMPTGPEVRATLTGAADAPIQWVVESGSGSQWGPVATIQWDRGPAK